MSRFWPDSVPEDRARSATAVVPETLRRVALGAWRIASWWPGLVVVVIVYVAVAIALFDHSYPNLWGALGALVAGIAWYISPLRRLETRRRDRLGARALERKGP